MQEKMQEKMQGRKNKPIKLEKEITEKILNEEYEIFEKEKARKLKRMDREKKKKKEYKKKSVLNNKREIMYKKFNSFE